jgi:hypothetical protein
MSIQPDHDLLPSLYSMRNNIERDPEPRTPATQELYRLLAHRITELEAAHIFTRRGETRVSQAFQSR